MFKNRAGTFANLNWILLFLFCIELVLFTANVSASPSDLKKNPEPYIQELFPKLTRIEVSEQGLPLYSVFQLDQLLGYAWLSTDINNIPGFSGSPIHLLIGLSVEGKFSKVIVVDHNEPVFMHGLGNGVLDQFMDQYSDQSIKKQIIISTSNQSRKGVPEDGPVYFDGVSKATISVEIINDVTLSTALKVARQNLDGYALPSASILKQKTFEALDWDSLLSSGLVHQWVIDKSKVFTELDRNEDEYQEGFFNYDSSESDAFTESYLAYLNAPDVGINLLGEKVYYQLMANLKPGEHLLWIASNGIYHHIADNFKRGTVPDRISLQQGGLSIDIKDLDVVDPHKKILASGAPEITKSNIFLIKASSGFNLGSEIDLKLIIQLPRNHLITDSLVVYDKYQLPQLLWEHVELKIETALPLWVKLWRKKIIPVSIFTLSLIILLWVFIRQRQVSRHTLAFSRFRWFYLWFTLLFTGVYLQGQLSVVNIFTLLLSIKDGFNIFIFLLDPVIFILWVVTFISLFIWGRGLFCGWLCPFGALQEILSAVAVKLRFKHIRLSESLHRKLIYIKYPILIGLVALSFYSLKWSEKISEIEPFKTSITLLFIRDWPFVIYAVALLLIGMFIHKFYCRYVCPLGAGLAMIGLLRRVEWLERISLCGKPCQTCHHRCQIDAIKRDGSVDYNECIQCLECIVILNDDEQCVDKLLRRKNKVIPLQNFQG